VDLIEGVEEEEQHGSARSHVAVLVAVEVDGYLCFLGLLDLCARVFVCACMGVCLCIFVCVCVFLCVFVCVCVVVV